MKILSPRAYLFKKNDVFNLVLYRSKVQVAQPTENNFGIYDGCTKSESDFAKLFALLQANVKKARIALELCEINSLIHEC